MNDLLKIKKLDTLTKEECRIIYGGEDESGPSEDTGFWYDTFYLLTLGIIVNPKPTSFSTGVWMNII
ncbi:MAG: hypothetical protein GVY07_01760 [Bacteroidetes bacterium]|jgi:hypothetical protein|nr:hypothetical protein [Bacteroidota bacterium]